MAKSYVISLFFVVTCLGTILAAGPPPQEFIFGAAGPPPREFIFGAASPPPPELILGAAGPPPPEFIFGAAGPPPPEFTFGAAGPPPPEFMFGAAGPPPPEFIFGAAGPPPPEFMFGAAGPPPPEFIFGAAGPPPPKFIFGAAGPPPPKFIFGAAGPPPPVFIFGDSTSDVGTNTYIPECLFKSDFPRYGIDFDNFEATGRWSNRFNTIDYICKLMGYERSPEPFLSYGNRIISPSEMSRGVNFASAGSGLLYTTGQDQFIVPVPEQIKHFISIRNNAIDAIGQSEADAFFARSIFIISVGSNDMSYSYFRGLIRSQTIFLDGIMVSYKNAIEVLYGQGARNFGLISALPMGCLPLLRVENRTGGCLDAQNELSLNFYNDLNNLAKEISSNLKGFKYSLGNTYHMIMNFIENTPPSDGVVVDTACCGLGRFNGEQLCNVRANLCDNREKYAFWDPVHPTDATSKGAALAIYDGGLEFVSPINFRQLVAERGLILSQ